MTGLGPAHACFGPFASLASGLAHGSARNQSPSTLSPLGLLPSIKKDQVPPAAAAPRPRPLAIVTRASRMCVVGIRRRAGAGKHTQLDPFGARPPRARRSVPGRAQLSRWAWPRDIACPDGSSATSPADVAPIILQTHGLKCWTADSRRDEAARTAILCCHLVKLQPMATALPWCKPHCFKVYAFFCFVGMLVTGSIGGFYAGSCVVAMINCQADDLCNSAYVNTTDMCWDIDLYDGRTCDENPSEEQDFCAW